jgi:S-formylglutathione hydrolase FrmB
VDENPWTRWPETVEYALYLLDGPGDDHTAWSRETDVAELTADADLLVVMTAARGGGAYADWWQGGQGGQPAWETFHTVELPQLLERNWRAGDERAIAGSSMGGFGAMSYAARNPGMYAAAASYSGVVDTSGPENRMDPAVWGDKTEQADIWKAHNPLDLAAGLEGTDLFISYGDGTPGPFDDPDGLSESFEWQVGQQNERFAARLGELGIPVTVDAYGAGTHTWPYFDQELKASMPMILESLGLSST